MKTNSLSNQDRMNLIIDCRKSGLSDYQWCLKKGIKPGTFYSWINLFKKRGYTLPESQKKLPEAPQTQEVVKVDVVEFLPEKSSKIKQNACHSSEMTKKPRLAAELILGSTTLKIYNDANCETIQSIIKSLGGGSYTR